jgi:putative serine protease PepD
MRTDAVIVPGSAGGPVLGVDGRVVGVSSRMADSGEGFAVPINTAKTVLAQLRGTHKVIRPYLGIRGRTAAPPDSGAVLESVYPGGPAARIGLHEGDRIEAMDGAAVASIDALLDEISRRRPGQDVELTVVRDGSSSVLEATIAERPATLPGG